MIRFRFPRALVASSGGGGWIGALNHVERWSQQLGAILKIQVEQSVQSKFLHRIGKWHNWVSVTRTTFITLDILSFLEKNTKFYFAFQKGGIFYGSAFLMVQTKIRCFYGWFLSVRKW